MECLNCKKPVKQTAKKRAKLYCSDKCKAEYVRKQKAAKNPNKRGRGRPKLIKEIVANIDEVKPDYSVIAEIKTEPAKELFMGHPIPDGLSGIPLAVWKNNIKIKAKQEKRINRTL